MATIYDFKPQFQALLRPIAAALAKRGLSANDVTLGALVLSIAQGAWLALMPGSAWPLLALPVTLFLRMAMNAIDGLMAKEHDQATPGGAVLNEISDVVADAALYLPFALIAPFSLPWLFAIIFLATLTEFAGVLGVAHGKGRNYEGPMGKSDRALLFGALGALVAVFGVLPAWTWHIQPMTCVLLVWTVVNRIRAGLVEA